MYKLLSNTALHLNSRGEEFQLLCVCAGGWGGGGEAMGNETNGG